MNRDALNAEDIFLRASELAPDQRARFLDEHCSDDGEVRRELESLLRAHDSAGAFLETPAPAQLDLLARHEEGPPARVGPYEILGQLGAGGMGIVYLAEGGRPRRRVALKVLRSGFASASMRRRFELETEALARLQHPAIAQVYEAGTARFGGLEQPYFAMELVEGTPLTEFATRGRIGIRERLALVAEVADAVQHAHQRGVVHRDLKPGNVLVNAEGRPKVLDFGVARVADASATGAHTATGQMVGTLAYMSPEQVVGDAAAVDARSDVYALGVIAYELLAGRVPLPVSDRTIAEAARAIREDEPTALSTIDRSLRGDIDTMVRKAMDKDPGRRYQSASEFAADIRRFLGEEPIVARPPSTLYQLRKFARRNKTVVGGVAAVMVALVGGVVGTSMGMVKAMEQEQIARDSAGEARAAAAEARAEAAKLRQTKGFLQSILTGADDPNQGSAAALDLTVRDVVTRAAVRARTELADTPAVAADVLQTIGETLMVFGDFRAAEEHLLLSLEAAQRFAPAPSTPVSSALNSLGWLEVHRGNPAKAEEFVRRALDIPEELLASDRGGHASMLTMLGFAIDAQGRPDEAAECWRQALAIAEAHLPLDSEARMTAMNNLADHLAQKGRIDEAAEIMTEVEQTRRRSLGATHPEYLSTLANLATYQSRRFRFDEAKALYGQVIEAYRSLYGPDHPSVARVLNNYGTLLRRMNDLPGAEAAYREAIRIGRAAGAGRDRLPNTLQNLASLRHEVGDLSEAASLFQEALALVRDSGNPSDQAMIMGNLGALRYDQGQWTEAERLFRTARDMNEAVYGPDAVPTLYSTQSLGSVLRKLGRVEESLAELERAVTGIRAAFREENPAVALAEVAHGRGLAAAGRLAEAEPVLARALDLMRGWSTVNAVRLTTAEAAYGECLMLLGRIDEAEPVLAAALDRRRQAQGQDHPNTLEVELILAQLRAAQGRADEANAIAERVLAVRAAKFGECEATAEAREILASLPGR